MTLVFGISIVPRWFDPAESEGLVTPFIFYYALHDSYADERRAWLLRSATDSVAETIKC